MRKVMVVDDDEKSALTVTEILEKEGFMVATFTSPVHAIKTISAIQDIDLILTDIRMPSVTGMEILDVAIKRKRPIPVIVFTGYGDVDTAVDVMRRGASDFLCKPVSAKELIIRVNRVLEKHKLAEEVTNLRKKLEVSESFHSLIGRSKRMQEVYELISAVAQTDSTVLIRGETGTGKELVARAIHQASHRRNEPFVGISCTALQHTLLESELFGHEKGAFTGAHTVKIGKLESARDGTVLLDEIGDISLDIQAKLLRVLQEKEFERVGGVKPIKLRARIIAATNRDLEEAVKAGRFREDLYYRLNVVPIEIPPLRERGEDILTLANYFLDLFKKRYDKNIEGFAPSAIREILEHRWPGNVRELKNVIERTVLTNPRRWIDKLALPEIHHDAKSIFNNMPGHIPFVKAKETVLQELEKTYLVHYMRQEKGRINRVAELMGVSTRTISRQLEKYGLNRLLFKEKRD